MKKTFIILMYVLIFLVITCAGYVYYLKTINLIDYKVLDNCERIVLSKLVSPSSYKLVSGNLSFISIADYERAARVEGLSNEFIDKLNNDPNPTLREIKLTFDASNSFGANIRQVARCSYYSDSASSRFTSLYYARIGDNFVRDSSYYSNISKKENTAWLLDLDVESKAILAGSIKDIFLPIKYLFSGVKIGEGVDNSKRIKIEVNKQLSEIRPINNAVNQFNSSELSKTWTILIAATTNIKNAEKILMKLRKANYNAYTRSEDKIVRVFVGPFIDKSVANKVNEQIQQQFNEKGIIREFKPSK